MMSTCGGDAVPKAHFNLH